MKFSLIILVLVSFSSWCQSPLQYPNSEKFHYFTSAAIDSLELHDIYELEKTEDTGGMGENIDLMHYYLSPADGYYSANWHAIYDSTDAEPALDTLVNYLDETFINGVEWQFDSNHLSMSGGHGYGTLSMSYYEYLDTVTLVNRLTKHSPTEELGIITYYENGLPKQFIGWETIDSFEEEIDDSYAEFNLDLLSTNPDLDTTLYTYDENLKLISIKDLRMGNDRFNLFTALESQRPELFHQCYIGSDMFSTRIQELIGNTPATVLFEISPLHAFVFKLDKSSGKYYLTDYCEIM